MWMLLWDPYVNLGAEPLLMGRRTWPRVLKSPRGGKGGGLGLGEVFPRSRIWSLTVNFIEASIRAQKGWDGTRLPSPDASHLFQVMYQLSHSRGTPTRADQVMRWWGQHTLSKWCAGKCLATGQLSAGGRKVLVGSSCQSHGVNIPTTVNFILPRWHHWTQHWEKMYSNRPYVVVPSYSCKTPKSPQDQT